MTRRNQEQKQRRERTVTSSHIQDVLHPAILIVLVVVVVLRKKRSDGIGHGPILPKLLDTRTVYVIGMQCVEETLFERKLLLLCRRRVDLDEVVHYGIRFRPARMEMKACIELEFWWWWWW